MILNTVAVKISDMRKTPYNKTKRNCGIKKQLYYTKQKRIRQAASNWVLSTVTTQTE